MTFRIHHGLDPFHASGLLSKREWGQNDCRGRFLPCWEIIKRLQPISWNVKAAAIIDFLGKQPELVRISQSIQQKPIEGKIV